MLYINFGYKIHCSGPEDRYTMDTTNKEQDLFDTAKQVQRNPT
jgi:hypothetical protein